LLKEGKLTEEEYNEIKRHVIIAKNILTDIINKFGNKNKYFTMCLNIAAYHHEKYDGTGYAEGLKGNEISLEARIYALCDVYDAIRSKRPYKEEKSHEETVEIIKGLRGTYFDPDIVDAFIRCNQKFMEAYETYSLLTESKEIKEDERDNIFTNIVWSEKLSVGVQIIDNQHQELIRLINNMISSVLKGQGETQVGEAIDFLNNYIVVHFNAEEQIMINSNYPEYGLHIKQHLYFIEKTNDFKTRFDKKGVDSGLLIDLNREIVKWLVNHICKSDKRLGEYLIKNKYNASI
ncbi:MAG: bacteriohemerythrin, partial [Thermodesulfovibrionales bacterium]|nr:bacteriohemerythrin [Thermodesulfovibrionales bacterium]